MVQNDFCYEEIRIGQTETFTVRIREDMVETFGLVTGDNNPLHTDEIYARESGYAGKVVYGMLTASFLSTLAGGYLPGKNALIMREEMNFLQPVYVGDELIVSGKVIEKNDKYRFIVLKVLIKNQNDVRVGLGRMEVGVRE